MWVRVYMGTLPQFSYKSKTVRKTLCVCVCLCCVVITSSINTRNDASHCLFNIYNYLVFIGYIKMDKYTQKNMVFSVFHGGKEILI